MVARTTASSDALYGWAEKTAYTTPYVANPDERSLVIGTIDFDDSHRRRRDREGPAGQRDRRHRALPQARPQPAADRDVPRDRPGRRRGAHRVDRLRRRAALTEPASHCGSRASQAPGDETAGERRPRRATAYARRCAPARRLRRRTTVGRSSTSDGGRSARPPGATRSTISSVSGTLEHLAAGALGGDQHLVAGRPSSPAPSPCCWSGSVIALDVAPALGRTGPSGCRSCAARRAGRRGRSAPSVTRPGDLADGAQHVGPVGAQPAAAPRRRCRRTAPC